MLHLQNGVAAMAWGCSGYRLVLAEAGMAAQVLELSLAKSPRGSHRILHPSVSQAASGRPAPSEIHILQVSTPAESSESAPNFPKCRATYLFNADETGLTEVCSVVHCCLHRQLQPKGSCSPSRAP